MARELPMGLFIDGVSRFFRRVPVWWCLPIAVIVSAGVYAGTMAFVNGLVGGLPGDGIEIDGRARMIGWLFAGVFGAAVLLSGVMAMHWKKRRAGLFAPRQNLETVRKISWREFELLIGEAFRRKGYRVVERGGAGPDGGVDLELRREGEKALVQCKQYRRRKIGIKPVRELYGVATGEGANRSIFVSSHDYSDEAKAFADGKPIELIDGERLVGLLKMDVNGPRSAEPMATELRASDDPKASRMRESNGQAGCEARDERRPRFLEV